MMGRKILLLFFVLVSGASVAEAAGSGSSVYGGVTAGFWRWDSDTAPFLELTDRTGVLYGGRIGYSPIEAFSGELVILTGTNDGVLSTNDSTLSLRLTQIEVSALVNFQSLISSPVYPFLDLGLGVALRRGGTEVDGESVFDETRFVFHLGGGLKMDVSEKVGLRFNIRDTFFTETQGGGNEENQVTVDSVELSVGLEYRIPLTHRGGPQRLR